MGTKLDAVFQDQPYESYAYLCASYKIIAYQYWQSKGLSSKEIKRKMNALREEYKAKEVE